VILEDDESDIPEPEPEATAVSASVDAGADPAFDLSKPVYPSSHEAWWDVEDGCYIDDDLRPISLLEQEGLASTPDQPHSCYHSPRPSLDPINQHDNSDGDNNNETMRGTSDEPASHIIILQPLDENSEGGNDKNASKLEISMQLAFEEQEKSLSAPAPSSCHSHRPSGEPSHLQLGQENDQSGTGYGILEGPGQGFPLCSQNEVGETGGIEIQQQEELVGQDEELGRPAMSDQQNLVEVVDADDPKNKETTEALPAAQLEIEKEYRHTSRASQTPSPSAPSDPAPAGESESGKWGEKRGRQDTHTEISSETHPSVNTDDTCETQPAKRRKRRSAPAVTLPFHVRRSRRLLPPSTTSLEIDDAQPQADRGCPSTLVNDEQHHASRISQCPVATGAVPVAEYQEWPFHGFLKRTRIGDDITYNLEFKLPLTSSQSSFGGATTAEAGNNHIDSTRTRPQNSTAVDARALAPRRSKLSISYDNKGLSDSDPECSSDNDGCSSEDELGRSSTSRQIRWSDLDEQRLLAYKKEGKPWEWIFDKFPGRTRPAVRTRWNMVRPRGD
jgi:hypothetical protein